MASRLLDSMLDGEQLASKLGGKEIQKTMGLATFSTFSACHPGYRNAAFCGGQHDANLRLDLAPHIIMHTKTVREGVNTESYIHLPTWDIIPGVIVGIGLNK